MRIHYLQHVAFEDLGSMAQDFQDRGFTITATHWYLDEPKPTLDTFDALIVMGGPMGVHDQRIYPWLTQEKEFIKESIEAGKTVLGICLGAQLIADVLGAEVRSNSHKEIGWFPLEITKGNSNHPLAKILAKTREVFHWHGDTFSLPKGALHLAGSAACANQAYIYQDHVYGFQFHLETTFESAQALTSECPEDLIPGPFVQDAETMLHQPEKFSQINQTMREVIDVIFRKCI